MTDVFSKAKRSEVMSRIRGRGNRETELALVKLFRMHHIIGWRRHVLLSLKVQGSDANPDDTGRQSLERIDKTRKMRVRPDFVFPKRRLAVFVDGCFWHGCPVHATQPKNNAGFWQKKLAANRTRDRLVNQALGQKGWKLLRIWEHDLKIKHRATLLENLENALEQRLSAKT